jgi:diguanylate cyclase (GGDEF)-like protein
MDHWFSRVYTDDLPRLQTALDMMLSGEARTLEAEIRMRHSDGVFRWFLARGLGIKGQDGLVERIVGAITDITGRKHAEERAAFMALHDGLTGLPNRQLMLDRLDQTIQRRDRAPDQPFALLVIDLDRFRIVNESLGHHVGDQLLVRLAERLQGVVRRADTVARLGADQFAVLIDELGDPAGGVGRAEAMRALIARSIGAPGIDGIRLDSSVGVRVWRAESVTATDLLRDATLAMQEAKRRGGDCVVEFFSELKTHVLRAYRYESELRAAIQNGGIEAFYQPIVDIASGVPSGFEALARLRLPSGELASPADFIPVAEETGLIAELARLVVEQSVDQLANWQVRFPRLRGLTIAVNLSPKQFDRQDVVTDIRKAAARAGIACDTLKVEITESVLMQNPTSAASILGDLKSLGVQVGIDDFGTGYSSLSYLREFDFDFLKIDQSFTRRLLSTKRDQELVRTIVQLGQNVGMTVVAEGVERADQLALLGKLGCHRAQGFLFARPLPAADATAWLARHAQGE